MDVLVDLLPPSYTAKAEPSSKDSDQKRQEQHNKSSNSSLDPVEVKANAQTLVDTERRAGEDRREQEINRGRWLESRISKDRRANALTVFVKV
ncbi:hypothetical protein H4J38_15275 [Colwellia sp. BRX10-3]|uniref:hypothetical protein n=1 Tax=Colwellia sp. BRX10-3 TaxID=2759844 RepID=UPI0015F77762|nr:hypothetical protein [Colwellia sp. BRX10-3]MBA6392134.1 hypothetical protein [Colwellia sp. BRX10-3]